MSHIEYLRNEEGATDLRHAVVQGSIDRVMPILTTALCTGLERSSQCGARRWRARERDSSADGHGDHLALISSIALNMLVVPAAYYAAHARRSMSRTVDGLRPQWQVAVSTGHPEQFSRVSAGGDAEASVVTITAAASILERP